MTDGVSPQFHGGDLAIARQSRPGIADWIDLSTGINPAGYPAAPVGAEIWRQLPDTALTERCLDAARAYYGVPQTCGCVQGAGSQQLIQLLPHLLPGASVAIVGPTYNEHQAAWATGSATVRQISAAELDCADDRRIFFFGFGFGTCCCARSFPLRCLVVSSRGWCPYCCCWQTLASSCLAWQDADDTRNRKGIRCSGREETSGTSAPHDDGKVSETSSTSPCL